MQFNWKVRLGMVIGGAVIVAVALAGAAWGALDPGIVRDALTLIGGLLGGLGIAGGPGRVAAAVLLFAVLPWLPSCGAGAQVDVERCTATVLRCAVEVAADCIPQDDDACPLREPSE